MIILSLDLLLDLVTPSKVHFIDNILTLFDPLGILQTNLRGDIHLTLGVSTLMRGDYHFGMGPEWVIIW